ANSFSPDAITCAGEVGIILAHRGDLIKKMRECQSRRSRSMEIVKRV
ncbi:9615_t:CDS:1, partial [Paraglomus occultum]